MESPETTPQEGELEESQEGDSGEEEQEELSGTEAGVENPAEPGEAAPTG